MCRQPRMRLRPIGDQNGFLLLALFVLTLGAAGVGGDEATPLPQQQPVIIASPNGGEVWRIDTTQTIRWTINQGAPSDLAIQIMRGVPGNWVGSLRIAEYGPLASTPTAYSWYIDPNMFIPEADYWIELCMASSHMFLDGSDGNFALSGGGPNLILKNCDIAPVSPVQLQPGNLLALGAFVENNDSGAAGPFWVEVWGSRTGGLTLDRFLTDSLLMANGLGGGESYSWVTPSPLYSIPDGPYTVVYVADRPGNVVESSERDNRGIVRGKRILVIRPQTQVDLVVENFGLAPNPAQSGQPISLSGQVVNRGTEASGPFWIEFWGSWDWPYPGPNFFLCDSIYVENLGAGAAINLASYPRRLNEVPVGVFMVGCVADRDDAINELNEANNFQFVDGQVSNHPWPIQRQSSEQPQAADIVITAADFTPCAPVQSRPGDLMTCSVTIQNVGATDTASFWIEFWGSRDGGLTLSDLLRESLFIANLRPGQTATLVSHAPLYSLPDGPYSLTVAADRPGEVDEANERNNRLTVPGKRLLTIRPQGQANLKVVFFEPYSNMDAEIVNSGTADSGPFWVEFWAAPGNPAYPGLNYFAADSIFCPNLPPGGELWTRAYERLPFDWLRRTNRTIICFVDRLDQVAETDETDNYAFYHLLPDSY